MISVENRTQRILESRMKIESPFELDETLCLYSPQDNVDALAHPRIAAWLDFIQNEYRPDLPKAERKVLLFMPCTKTKPYPFSSEHKAINQRLLEAGFRPTQRHYLPQELQARLEPHYDSEVLNLSPLDNGRGTVIHRMVISEPMAVVPYEHIVSYRGSERSPAAVYDDPGLFEKRGNAVSPWRADSTAVAVSATRWRWGDEERRGYVTMHNAMADALAKVVTRIGRNYTDIVAWVAPGLTHRSFVISRDERSANKVVATRLAGTERLPLVGANDHLGSDAITCLPTLDQCRDSVMRLAKRLGTDVAHATAIYARGGANATPLALPELLDVLIARLDGVPAAL